MEKRRKKRIHTILSVRTTPVFWRALPNWSYVTLPLFWMSKNLKVFVRKVPWSCVGGHFYSSFDRKSVSNLSAIKSKGVLKYPKFLKLKKTYCLRTCLNSLFIVSSECGVFVDMLCLVFRNFCASNLQLFFFL